MIFNFTKLRIQLLQRLGLFRTMNQVEEALEGIVSNANCYADLSPLLQHVELNELKSFLQQKIKDKSPIHFYFKSVSIINICGVDVIKKCLSYLSLHELYRYQIICKTFQSLNKLILSSPEMVENYAKYNERMVRFKDWMAEKNRKSKRALFQLVEFYGKKHKYSLKVDDLRGEDELLVKALNEIGCEVKKLTRALIAPDDLYDDEDEYEKWESNPDPVITGVHDGYHLRFDRYFDYDSIFNYADKHIGFKGWMERGYSAGKMVIEVLRERPEAGPGYIEKYDIWHVILVDVMEKK